MRIRILAALLFCTARAAAADLAGLWPPDPKRFAPAGTEVAPGLEIGDVLEQSNADAAKDLLPAEILKHYKDGGYRNPVVSWPDGLVHFDRSFEAATRENAGKYDIDPKTGTIVEKGTGKVPDYTYGLPFPEVSPDDPSGGVKAIWNKFHVWWNQGSYHFNTLIVWAKPTGLERQATVDVNWQFYGSQDPKYRLPNAQNFLWQAAVNVLNPADLQGTAVLTYRYRDPTKRDAVWTYVPALRRVRAASPANRSDGFLGSDLSQDDGHFFDGKTEDFEWKTVGIREGLRIVDPDSVRGEGGPLEFISDKEGFRDTWVKAPPAAGYLVPDWKGVGWAPVSAALAKRKFWVIEGVPRDRYYLYGKLELWVDTETWIGAWNRKYSWKGELLNTYQVSAYLSHPATRPDKPDDVEWMWSAQHAWQCAEAVRNDRATLAGIRTDRTVPFDRRVRHNVDQLFDLQMLSRQGK